MRIKFLLIFLVLFLIPVFVKADESCYYYDELFSGLYFFQDCCCGDCSGSFCAINQDPGECIQNQCSGDGTKPDPLCPPACYDLAPALGDYYCYFGNPECKNCGLAHQPECCQYTNVENEDFTLAGAKCQGCQPNNTQCWGVACTDTGWECRGCYCDSDDCSADSRCHGQEIGEDCDTGMVCDSSCQCVAAVCVPDGCNRNCPTNCTVADDPDCGCADDDGCCGIGCDSTSDNDCPAACVPTDPLCDGNCPPLCTVDEDPDCGCKDYDFCCGIFGCDYTNDNDCPPPGPVTFPIRFRNPFEYESIEDVINAIIDILLMISIPVAILLILIGGFYFITSGGDPEKIKTAKRIIFWTIIGFAIVLFAKGIVSLIREVIGASWSNIYC